MENGPSKSPETPFGPPETSGPDKGKSEKDLKSSKKTKGKNSLSKLPERPAKPEPKVDKPVLEKLLGESSKEDVKPGSGNEKKPAVSDDFDREKRHEKDDGFQGEIKIDHLSHEESREVASDYIDIRHADVQEELKEVQKETEGGQAAIYDERWLEEAKEQLESNPAAPVEASLEEATQEVVAEMREEFADTASGQPGSQFEAMAHEAVERSAPVREFMPAQEQAHRAAEAAAVPSSAEPAETAISGASRSETTKSSWYPALVPWGSEVWRSRRWHLMRHRRERLKTEDKIKQVERNLQKEVRAVQEQVAGHEVSIRRMSAEQVRRRTAEQTLTNEVPPHAHERYVATLREAILPPPPTPPEGHVAKLSEAVAPRGPIERPSGPAAETLSHAELLEESADITVSGVTLRSIYEDKRISEPGLRRLVEEYHRGGDMQLKLAEEMVEHEREFELDPLMRDDHPIYEWLHPGGGTGSQGSSAAANSVGSQPSNNMAAAESPAELRRLRSQKNHALSDAQFMTAGFTLLIIIIVLIIVVASSR